VSGRQLSDTQLMPIPTLWFVLYWSWILTEIYVAVVTRTRRGSGTIDDRGSMLTLWIVIFSSITVASWVAFTVQATAMPPARWLRPASLGLLAVGLLIRWVAIYSLGRAFSANVAIHATQKLNRSGVFHYMRHPSYTGMLLIFLALGLRMHNWLSLGLMILPPAAALLYRIHVEEAALGSAFAEYADYSRTTKRLIPGIY
jgi:protein-S-isoprenylcysteine O-methyltransferase Ste14